MTPSPGGHLACILSVFSGGDQEVNVILVPILVEGHGNAGGRITWNFSIRGSYLKRIINNPPLTVGSDHPLVLAQWA